MTMSSPLPSPKLLDKSTVLYKQGVDYMVRSVLTSAQSRLKPRCPYGKYVPPKMNGTVAAPLTTREFVERFLQLYSTVLSVQGIEGNVCLQPITPSCRELVREGLRNMSERSKYLRFCRNLEEISDTELNYLTHLDFDNHFAIGAGLETKDGRLVPLGTARYVRLKDKREVAEVAVAVVDAYQRHGIGKLLLLALSVNAEIQGIDTFRVFVHPSNTVVLQVVRECTKKLWSDDGLTVADCKVTELVPRLCSNGVKFSILSGPNMISPNSSVNSQKTIDYAGASPPPSGGGGDRHKEKRTPMPALMRHGFVGDVETH